MAIKDDAYDLHFVSRPEEATLARRLDDSFDVSYGDLKNTYSFWFGDPKKHTCERFGLQQQVLIIYSPHPNTDSRVLNAISSIQEDSRFSYRLDPTLILLIHRGDPVRTRDLLRDTEQDRIIVPFSADELFNPSKGPMFIRLRIAEYVGKVDLFGITSPITLDEYFFGRDALVQQLVVRSASQAENSGVFGLRKTGKTSALHALERRVSKRSALVEYVDCHSPGIYSVRWWEALENIVERLREKLARVHKRRAHVQLDYSRTTAGSRFGSDIQALLQGGDLKRILLMLDEVEWITPGLSGQLGQHWDQDFLPFWQTIRATHQETQGKLVFIVAGVNPQCVQEPRFGQVPNPIFQLAAPYFLEPFHRDHVREMVRSIGRYSGLKFDEDIYDYLRERYGGHPFLIRIACSEVWRNVPIDDPQRRLVISIRDFEEREAAIRARLEKPMKDILLSLVWWYPDEYDLLQLLASGQSEFVREWIYEHPQSLFQFAQYGILRDSNSTDFAIADLRDFLTRYGDEYKEEISPYRRGDIDPELLPEEPDPDTLLELFKMRSEVEVKLRRTIAWYLGHHVNWDPEKISEAIIRSLHKRPARKDPQALFVGRPYQEAMTQLYTLDLKWIILANWQLFSSLFESDQKRFTMNMDTINTARRVDAHAKPFTSSEVKNFHNSYGWMLDKVDRVMDQVLTP